MSEMPPYTFPDQTTFTYDGGQPDQDAKKSTTHLIISGEVEEIADDAFSRWRKLKSVQFLGQQVQRIGKYAFNCCSSLMFISIPDSVKEIGEYAFSHCYNLVQVRLPNGITTIGSYAFRFCKNLSVITVPSTVTSIDRFTFDDCKSLSRVIIPSSVTLIDTCAFRRCENLVSIKLPSSIHDIDASAFERCMSLQLPPSLTTLRQWPFDLCKDLRILYMSEPSWRSIYLPSYSDSEECFNSSNAVILKDPSDPTRSAEPLTLQELIECVNDLSDEKIPTQQQLDTLHQVLHVRNQEVAEIAQQCELNLLHLFVYFPGNITDPMTKIITKCPVACASLDSTGRSPLHHAITSTKHNMDDECYNLLLRHAPDTTLHDAIRSQRTNWSEIKEIAGARYQGLTNTDDESSLHLNPVYQGLKIADEATGLMPFMMAADAENSLDMNAVFRLLTMQPDVMVSYLDENSTSKPKLEGIETSCEDPDEMKRRKKRKR